LSSSIRGHIWTSTAPELQLSTAMLETLPEEGLEADHITAGTLAAQSQLARRSGRTLARTSSAPGQFQPLHSFVGSDTAEDPSSLLNEDEEYRLGGGSMQVGAFVHTRRMPAEGNAPMPRIHLDRHLVEVSKLDSEGLIQNTPPGSLLLKQSSLHQSGAPCPQSQAYFMVQTRPVTWTPRGSSPTHKRLATPVQDQGRNATPASTTLTPRHPQIVQMGSLAASAAGAGPVWSVVPPPAVQQVSPMSPFATSPARQRMPGSNYGFHGGSVGNNAQRSGRILVQKTSSGSMQSGSFPLALGESGTRSVGVPPPERPSFSMQSPPGTVTPPTAAWHPEIGNVVTATPLQRRARHSTG
jgi:hypothetical protein